MALAANTREHSRGAGAQAGTGGMCCRIAPAARLAAFRPEIEQCMADWMAVAAVAGDFQAPAPRISTWIPRSYGPGAFIPQIERHGQQSKPGPSVRCGGTRMVIVSSIAMVIYPPGRLPERPL
jgi:hypothetical protein